MDFFSKILNFLNSVLFREPFRKSRRALNRLFAGTPAHFLNDFGNYPNSSFAPAEGCGGKSVVHAGKEAGETVDVREPQLGGDF